MDRARNAFEEPIRIAFRPSPRITGLQLAAHLGAGAALIAAGIPAWLQWTALLLIAGSLYRTLAEFARAQADPAPPLLLLNSHDQWRQLYPDRSEPLQRGNCCCVSALLVVLHLCAAGRSDRFFLLAADNVDADTLRRLRVRLAMPLAGVD